MRKAIRNLWNLVKFSSDEIMMMKHVRAARLFRRDLKHITKARCASCGGHATKLRLDGKSAQWICKDRKTCRQTMIFASMLRAG